MKKIIVFILLHCCVMYTFAQINTERVMIIGRNALYYEDYIIAIQSFNQVIKVKPWLDQPYFYRAVAKIYLDDFTGAEEDCTLALQQNPFMIRAYFVRGIARQSLGLYDLAIEDYQKGCELKPKDQPMMNNIAIAYIQKKDFEKAKELFNELIGLYPKDMKSYVARGSLYAETGDTVSAMNDYNKAIEIDPYYPYAYGNRALLNYQAGKMEEALVDFSEAILLNPREEGFYINRGLIRYNLNDLKGAMSDYDNALTLNSNNLIARFNRGLLRNYIGDYNRAIEDFDVVISLEPDNYMAYYNRALLRSQTGNFQAAINDYNVILAQYPNFAPAYYNRGEAKQNLNDSSGAEQDKWFAMELERTRGNATIPTQMIENNPSLLKDDQEQETEESKATREESDKNISKFNRLVVYNKNDEQINKYQSEIRGRVQDKNIRIDIEKQFVLTYYEKTNQIKEFIHYSKTINDFNDRRTLGWKLLITNQEASLNEFQIEAHNNSINELSEKIENDAKNADYFFGRGIDYMLVQDFSEALQNFDQAILLDPSFILGYFNRAAVRYKQLDYERSNATHDDMSDVMSIQLNANKGLTGSNRISSATPATPALKEPDNQSRAYEMILRDYGKVIQLDPSFIFAYFNRANLLCTQQDFKAAILDYNEALRRNPNFAEAYFNRGLARLSLGDQRGLIDLSKAGELGIINAYNIIKRMTSE